MTVWRNGAAFVKRVINSGLRWAGLEIRRVRGRHPREPRGHTRGVPRMSMRGSLEAAHRLGWAPRTCIDVGAAFGNFTLECADVFPEADFLLVEPLQEYRPFLESVSARLPRARYATAAAAAHDGDVTLNVHSDLVGSSLMRETEGPITDGSPRVVPAKTLDGLCQGQDLRGPYLLKIDVQGAELGVLKGAGAVLQDAEYVLLEVSLFRFFIDGPEIADVIAFMRSRGFVAYDVFDLMYRPLDGALSQLDLAFVKESGIFRQQHVYATPAQRCAQDALFAESLARARIGLGDRRTSS